MLKIAALQFATGTDVAANLATCLRMIDRAGAGGARLMVMPEFCNHISWYRDQQHAWDCALEPEGEFLGAIAQRAQRLGCYILINVSLRRHYPQITVTSLLYGPNGNLLGEADKQSLMGHENDFFTPATRAAGLVNTEFGRIGFVACRDGISFEPARRLALAGADLLCNSLNSFAFDEASLHVRARAAENRLFMIAANKVGPLVPEAELAQVSALTAIPEELLYGAGESQVVDPNGQPLALAERGKEQVLLAEIPERGLRVEMCMGTLARRRRSLYRGLADMPLDPSPAAAEQLDAVMVDPAGQGEAAVARAVELLMALPDEVALALLPACFAVEDASAGWAHAAAVTAAAEQQLIKVCREKHIHIATSVIEEGPNGWHHLGVLLDGSGRVLAQPQLHRCPLGLAPGGDDLLTADLPWGRVALLVGDDCHYPELARVAALRGVHCLLVVQGCGLHDKRDGELQGSGEHRSRLRVGRAGVQRDLPLLLSARAAENRVCLAAVTRGGAGLLATLEREFTLMQPWQQREFDGNINKPLITVQDGEVTRAILHPLAARNKMISANTHLLRSRAHLSTERLLSAAEGGA